MLNQRRTFLQDLISDLRQEAEGLIAGQSLWTPNAGPQKAARDSPADELFYGGQAGGGKTDLGLGLAITEHRSSVFFRREFSQLRGPEGAWQRALQIIGDYGKPNEALYVIRGLPGNRFIEFAGMQQERDKNKWKGRPHDLYVFDEITEFLESQYRFTIGWNRTTHTRQRTRVLGTGNPPTTSEGRWVIEYWGAWLDKHHPKPAVPGELRWYAEIDGRSVEVADGRPFKHKPKDRPEEMVKPKSRTFIAAAVKDNPFLMRTDYVSRLQNMPEPLRSQLLYGDFNISQNDNVWQIIPTAWIQAAQARWTEKRPNVPLSQLGCDPSRGGGAETVCAKRYGEWIAPLEIQEGKNMPDGPHVAGFVILTLGRDKKVLVTIDVSMIGSSPYDFLKTTGVNVVALNGAEGSKETDKSGKLGFANKRAEWHWKLREMLDPSSDHKIALPPDPRLAADLCAPRWRLTPRGIQVELKEEIIERIGRSPDRGEAVIYAFAEMGTKQKTGNVY